MKLSPGYAFKYYLSEKEWVIGTVVRSHSENGREGYIADVPLPGWGLNGKRMWVWVDDVYPPF